MVNSRLADEHKTLAELLKEGGYRTAAFVDSGWVRAIFGFDQGFDIYDDGGNDIRGIARILPKVKTWLDENKSDPFFLFWHVFDIHAPYDPPPPFNSMFHDSPYTGTFVPNVKSMDLAARKSLKLNAEDLRHTIALYDGDIRYADEKIGEFLSYLQSTGLWDQLCIIITSDHGEEFNEHGSYLHWQLYYRPDLHVPLIMRIPRYSQREIRISKLSQSIDLLPTILEIAGLPPHLKAQGRSLIPLIIQNTSFFNRSIQHIAGFFKKNENAAFAERETCFTEVQDLSIIRDGYQMIYNLKSGSTQLYNITIDKYAQNDIAKDHVDITKSLVTELKKAYSSTPQFKASSIILDEETQEHLKALGYVQ
jgi:arylsulfatase A-like enzyme